MVFHRESSSRRKVTPPSPSYMDSNQFASYLAGLRESRQNRPAGARPQPPSISSRRESVDRFSTARPAEESVASQDKSIHGHSRGAPSDVSACPPGRPSYSGSMASRHSAISRAGKDYYPDTSAESAPPDPSELVPSATYMERGQRWMEKEEVVSLRQAMDDMDLQDTQPASDEDDKRLFNAAQDEASELVWQHQHGVKPPEPGTPYRYKGHLRKNSYAHARAASIGRRSREVGPTGLARDMTRSASASSSGSDGRRSPDSTAARRSSDQPRRISAESTRSRMHGITNGGPHSGTSHRRRSSLRRNISGEIQRPFSGDQIWEEPESSTSDVNHRQPKAPTSSHPLGAKTRGPLNEVPKETTSPEESRPPTEVTMAKRVSKYEIHRNPPSQSRNPNYMTNSPFDRPRPSRDVPKKNGMEVRSDDIREATSMRLKDRSEKLPTPSAVSDSPGRPIVSFDKTWKAPDAAATDAKPEEPKGAPLELGKNHSGAQQDPNPSIPAIAVAPPVPASSPFSQQQQSAPQSATPPIPSIHIASDDDHGCPSAPSVTVSCDDDPPSVPSIAIQGDDPTPPSTKPRTRPLPIPQPPAARPAERSGHWSRAPGPAVGNRATAICNQCRHPIEGRFIALRGASDAERFHPSCFRCHCCGTSLEALEISPEPDTAREARLDRIRRRACGEVLSEEPGKTMAEDGDERLRFYCHLDWHELYAPRCGHCTTSILGDHVFALGKHWHHGHFFCAECGDPFEKGATHIEKDGYAWCVGCQTKRTERRAPKCKACKRAVVGQYVQALGGEWHEACFLCAGCQGGFEDGQIFPVQRASDGMMVVHCTKCRTAELKR